MNLKLLLLGLASFGIVFSAPAQTILSPGGVIPVSIAPFSAFTQFSRAAYCRHLESWNCGAACDALPGFIPSIVGGNGRNFPAYFVGYWPGNDTIIVAHQGTDPTSLLSLLVDGNVRKSSLDPTLFPGVPLSVLVHSGFARAHARSASSVLSEVKKLMNVTRTRSVTTVGHSLGGALAALDALFLALNLPSGSEVRGVTYGTPRVGNAAFAELLDFNVPDFFRINHRKDPIPIVPAQYLGFRHPSGEIHIDRKKNAVFCPGADNTVDSECSNQVVKKVALGQILHHLGPYDGIHIGTQACHHHH